MRLLFSVIIICILSFSANSQRMGDLSVGAGVGLAYGGLGGQINYQIFDEWGLYGGAGSALIGFGYNIGTRVAVKSNRRDVYFVDFLYGYNATIDYGSISKIYYGPSLGGSWSYYTKKKKSFWNVGLVIPFRSADFKEDKDQILISDGVSLIHFPVLVYAGFNILLNK